MNWKPSWTRGTNDGHDDGGDSDCPCSSRWPWTHRHPPGGPLGPPRPQGCWRPGSPSQSGKTLHRFSTVPSCLAIRGDMGSCSYNSFYSRVVASVRPLRTRIFTSTRRRRLYAAVCLSSLSSIGRLIPGTLCHFQSFCPQWQARRAWRRGSLDDGSAISFSVYPHDDKQPEVKMHWCNARVDASTVRGRRSKMRAPQHELCRLQYSLELPQFPVQHCGGAPADQGRTSTGRGSNPGDRKFKEVFRSMGANRPRGRSKLKDLDEIPT